MTPGIFARYSLIGGATKTVSLVCTDCNDPGSQITVTPFSAREQLDIMMQWARAHEMLSHAVRTQ